MTRHDDGAAPEEPRRHQVQHPQHTSQAHQRRKGPEMTAIQAGALRFVCREFLAGRTPRPVDVHQHLVDCGLLRADEQQANTIKLLGELALAGLLPASWTDYSGPERWPAIEPETPADPELLEALADLALVVEPGPVVFEWSGYQEPERRRRRHQPVTRIGWANGGRRRLAVSYASVADRAQLREAVEQALSPREVEHHAPGVEPLAWRAVL